MLYIKIQLSIILLLVATNGFAVGIGDWGRLNRHEEKGILFARVLAVDNSLLTVKLDGTGQELQLPADQFVVDRELQGHAGRLLPTMLLHVNALEGIGDLVHLEEYVKYLRTYHANRVNVIATAKIDTPCGNNSGEPAQKRATRLALGKYKELGIRPYIKACRHKIYSASCCHFCSMVDQVLQIEEKSVLTNIEHRSVSAYVEVSVSHVDGFPKKYLSPGVKNYSLPEYGHLRDKEDSTYGYNGPIYFRFYKEPGLVQADEVAQFWENLANDSAKLHLLLEGPNKGGRHLLPGDFKIATAAINYVSIFGAIYKACDFYLPHHLVNKVWEDNTSFKNIVTNNIAALTGGKVIFISPKTPEEILLNPLDDNTIRIFSGFDLSDSTYQGLYLYSNGEVVGYSGDDTFSLALSSGKLPFPDLHRRDGVQQNLLRYLFFLDPSWKVQNEKVSLADYLNRIIYINKNINNNYISKLASLADHVRKHKPDFLRLWLEFALDAYKNANAFRRLDGIVEDVLATQNSVDGSDIAQGMIAHPLV